MDCEKLEFSSNSTLTNEQTSNVSQTALNNELYSQLSTSIVCTSQRRHISQTFPSGSIGRDTSMVELNRCKNDKTDCFSSGNDLPSPTLLLDPIVPIPGPDTLLVDNADTQYGICSLNKKKRKIKKTPEVKDEKYWEKRKKNNIAAKKSRDARRMKELCIDERLTFLEIENMRLLLEISSLKQENSMFS